MRLTYLLLCYIALPIYTSDTRHPSRKSARLAAKVHAAKYSVVSKGYPEPTEQSIIKYKEAVAALTAPTYCNNTLLKRDLRFLKEAIEEGVDIDREPYAANSRDTVAHHLARCDSVAALRVIQRYHPQWNNLDTENRTVFYAAVCAKAYAATLFLAEDLRVDVHGGPFSFFCWSNYWRNFKLPSSHPCSSALFQLTPTQLLFEQLCTVDTHTPLPPDLIRTLLTLLTKRQVDLSFFCGRVRSKNSSSSSYGTVDELAAAVGKKLNDAYLLQPQNEIYVAQPETGIVLAQELISELHNRASKD